MFAIGLGPIPYIYPNEVFTIELRPAALSFAIFANWLCNTCTFSLLRKINNQFHLFSGDCFLSNIKINA